MPRLTPAFNDFLFATVCEERNEMPLSVISALARLDLDPWREAEGLAASAASRLSVLLAGYVDNRASQTDRAIAARLAALLPQPAKTGDFGPGSAGNTQNGPRFSLLGMLCLALMVSVATNFVMANLESGRGALRKRL